jgi:hypothetical protein
MSYALFGVEGIVGLIMLACLVMVIVRMFRSGDTTMGAICLFLILVCGTGVILTFGMGWIKSAQYGTKNIMYVWTGCIAAEVVLRLLGMALS